MKTQSNIVTIRESIEEAKRIDTEARELAGFVESRRAHLHQMITLPSDNATEALSRFVHAYIDLVPDFLESLSAYIHEANIYDDGKVLIDIAEGFFIKPPEVVNQSFGLRALLDEAYLAHRLVEEVNDRLLVRCGRSLIPVDMTRSNLVIHELLGESFANQLDLAVHYSVEMLFETSDIAEQAAKSDYLIAQHDEDWVEVKKRWPCFAETQSISLNLSQDAPSALH